MLARQRTFAEAIGAGDLKVEGDATVLAQLFGMLDDVPADFPIVEPRQSSVK